MPADAPATPPTPEAADGSDTTPARSEPLLRVEGLKAWFPKRSGLLSGLLSREAEESEDSGGDGGGGGGGGNGGGWVKAVDGVSFEIAHGECLGLVGESGSGKTTVGRTLLRLNPATDGRVTFAGQNVMTARGGDLRRLRRDMSIIFQDPAGSLDPRMRVESIVAEPLDVHGLAGSRKERRAKVGELLEKSGLPASAMTRYPHQFSGGQRQRIGIARALATNPKFIVCDEPTSALDVSVQAQVINLLTDLQRDLGLSYLFISHDMAVVQHVCQRIAVMKDGKIVEMGDRADVIERPREEYTKRLLEAVPEAKVG